MLNFIFGMIVSATIMFLFVMVPYTSPDHVWQGNAIERAYGLYCPATGHFAWVGECEGDNQ